MNETGKVTLEPTAAMALLFGKDIYKDHAKIAQYVREIDLNSGIVLAERLQSILNNAVEIMANRKYFYHERILNYVRNTDASDKAQVIILGAGYDPITIHLLDTEGDNIDLVIEIDMSDFSSKKMLFDKVKVNHPEKIKFVQADIVAGDINDIICSHGYDPAKPSIITMEGLMYYLTKDHFIETLKKFRTPDKRNAICLEYIFPSANAPTEELRKKQETCIETVEKQAQMKLQLYGTNEILDLIKDLGATSIEVFTQKDIEKEKTGQNLNFTQKGEGIFDYLSFKI